jgi:hypothetical protein
MRLPRQLAIVLAVAGVLMLAWIAATPAFQGPDESAHFAYVQNLAENGKTPDSNNGSGTESTEEGSALYYLNLRALSGNIAARPLWSKADISGWRAVEKGLGPDARKNAGGPNAIAKNPPLYYAYEAVPYRIFSGSSLFTRVFAMRLASGLLYVLVVLFTWLLASEIFARVWPRVVAAGLVALQPLLTFMGTTVGPDIMLAAVWTAFAFLAVRTLLRGPTALRLAGIAALSVASILTHGRGVAILPAALLTILLTYNRHRVGPHRVIRYAIAIGVPLVAVLIVVLGSRSGGLGTSYGGELNLPPEALHPGRFASFVWQFYLPKLPFMAPRLGPAYGYRELFVEGLFGRFGALETAFSRPTMNLIELALISGFLMFVASLVARRSLLRTRWDLALLLAGIPTCLVLFLHFASFRALVTEADKVDPLIVGRYLLPLVPFYAIGLAGVAAAWRRAGVYVGAVVLALALALQLGALGLVLQRFYG